MNNKLIQNPTCHDFTFPQRMILRLKNFGASVAISELTYTHNIRWDTVDTYGSLRQVEGVTISSDNFSALSFPFETNFDQFFPLNGSLTIQFVPDIDSISWWFNVHSIPASFFTVCLFIDVLMIITCFLHIGVDFKYNYSGHPQSVIYRTFINTLIMFKCITMIFFTLDPVRSYERFPYQLITFMTFFTRVFETMAIFSGK